MPTVLEDYFDFSEPGEIRIQGHRVWLHQVLYEYVIHRLTLEELALRFASLSMDELLACLLYYFRNRKAMDDHLAEYMDYWRRSRQEYEQKHGDWLAELRQRANRAVSQTHPQ